jgi:aspartate racemase
MKTLGIVGGLGPESTLDYYRAIQDRFHERNPGAGDPPLVITSLNSDRMRAYFDAWDLAAIADWLVAEFERLTRAGADFGLIAANTPHIVFSEVQARCSLPLVSIVEATCDKAVALGLERVGLLGTKFTMREGFFPAVFEPHAIQIFVPNAQDQEFVHEKYFSELFVGVFRDETRSALVDIARKLIERERIQGLILGGTELPLIMRDAPDLGIPLLDTTKIHVEKAVEGILSV